MNQMNGQMVIQAKDLEQFLEITASLVKAGITFFADGSALTIYCTGGF